MGNQPLLHPTEQTLSDFSLGKLDDGQVEVINNHLQECPDCQRLVAEMSSDSFLGRLRGAQGQRSATNGGSGSRGPIMSAEPGHQAEAGPLPPDLADHPDYQVVRELGRGGMGVVYLAHNRLMDRDEVLKVVSKHLIERKGVLERFSREIRSAARLMHPNIVHAFSAFRCGESVVFAMEYVDGLDLAKLVKSKGPMSVAHASYFVHQAALGLQHAHEQGMVHRDIKPGNLMLTRKGDKSIVKVLDFGLAKATRESPLEGALTHEGQMLGTPDFIAPEQIRDAQSAGIQADIYSLGCTLYYLLTGGPPFEAASLYDLLQAHFSMDAQPLNLVRPEVPAELAALVAKMMAKDAGRRFQTPAEVAEALKPFFKRASATARPDVSTLEQPGPGPEKVQNVSTVTKPATGKPRRPTEPAYSPSFPSESQLPSLGAFEESGHSGHAGAVVPAVGSGGRPRWRSRPLIAGGGALGFVVLGLIIVIIAKYWRVTIDTEKGTTTFAVGKTAGGTDGPSVIAVSTKTSGVSPPPTSAVTPASTPEMIAAASGAGSKPATSSLATPAAEQAADKASGPPAPATTGIPGFTNSINMKFVLIPAGEFMMGSPEDDQSARPDEKPQHKVRISPLYVSAHEVTQAQYYSVIGKNPRDPRLPPYRPSEQGRDASVTGGNTSSPSASPEARTADARQPTGEHPVGGVYWLDAILFCNKLSDREGRTPFYKENKQKKGSGPGYRLPTEAEWEYACRAGTLTRFSFGDDGSIFHNYAWRGPRFPVVGACEPNDFGLYDMHGGVAEWCSDWLGPYDNKLPVNDPTGPATGRERVIRGGSFWSPALDCRSAIRSSSGEEFTDINIGFRIVLSQSAEIKDLAPRTQIPTKATIDAKTPRSSSDSTSVQVLTERSRADSSREQRDGAGAGPLPTAVKPPVFTNSIGMKLSLIPAGEFMMGSPDAGAPPEERPEHKVRISTPFFLSLTEVTQAQYEGIVGKNPSYFSPTGEGKDVVAGKPTGEYPVEQVSWLDSIAFCNAVSKKESLAPYYVLDGEIVGIPDWKGPGYRLPTEAEWEYACRAGKSGKFPPGDPMIEYGWFRANSNGSTHPVGTKRPNEFGLFDMHANVFEWCFDGFAFDYYQRSPVDDPPGPDGMSTRVARGSGWRSPQRKTWWTRFEGRDPHQRHFVVGFRVARTQSPIQASERSTLPPAGTPSTAKPTAGPPPATVTADTPTTEPAQATANKAQRHLPAKGSPEDKLNTRGLTRAGAYLIVASEAEILEKFEKVRPLIATMAQPFNMFALALRNELLLAEAEAYFIEMRVRVDEANAVLSKMPNGARANSQEKLEYQTAQAIRDGLNQDRDNASRAVEAMRAQQIPAGRKEELVKDFKAKWSDFLRAADELTPLIDRALGEYRELRSDHSVTDALAALSRSTKAAALLGPSKNLQKVLDTIKEAKRAYAPETAAPKKKTRSAKTPPTTAPKKKGQGTKS